jgi:tetratricopeptide (TPR) repeat protein
MSIYLDRLKEIWHKYLLGELLQAVEEINELTLQITDDRELEEAELAVIYEAKGEILYAFEDKENALAAFNKSIPIRKKLLSGDFDIYMYIKSKTACIYAELGNSKEALSLLEELSSITASSFETKPSFNFLFFYNKSLAYSQLGRYGEALAENGKALQLIKKLQEISGTLVKKLVADFITQWGKILFSQGDVEQAYKCVNIGYDIRRNIYKMPHPDLIDSAIEIATISLSEHNFLRSIAEYSNAINLSKKVFGTEHKKTIELIAKLKDAYQELHEFTEIAIAKDDRFVPGYWQRREATKACFAEIEK